MIAVFLFLVNVVCVWLRWDAQDWLVVFNAIAAVMNFPAAVFELDERL